MELAPVLARLEAGHERILEELKEFTAIPSVSTDPAHEADDRAAAQWVAAKLEAAGPFTVRTMPTSSPPFTPTLRDGRLYARGVSDDKGPMLIPIKVAEAFVARHRELLAADVVISADGAMWRIDEPSLTVANRGLAGLELTLRGPAKDLHSGRHGGSVANPLHAMARLIASLHQPDGRVAVAGFYDRVRSLSPAERAEIAALPFDEAAYLAQVGASVAFGEPGYATLERQWTRPTLEVNGLWGGYQGLGTMTVVPSEAHAKITCLHRLHEGLAAWARLWERLGR